MKGYIKLHRKLLENPIFTSERGFRIWLWCLMRAGHKERDIYFGKEKIHLKVGQFVYGRDSAGESLGLSPSTVRNWIETLKVDRYLDIKSTNKYSIITILKWNEYQVKDNKVDNKVKTDEKPNNTNKNDKNVKNTTRVFKKSEFLYGKLKDGTTIYKVNGNLRLKCADGEFYNYGGELKDVIK